MSKPCSWFVPSLLLVGLACHRAESTAPAAPGTPGTSPTSAASEVAAQQPDCTARTDGEVCVERRTAGCEQGDAAGCVGAARIVDEGSDDAPREPARVPASPAPRGAAFIADANLQVESIAADGLELRDLMCAVTGGMPMLGALLIAGTLAKQKRALDRCAPDGQAFAVTWTLAGGEARDVTATGGTAAANTCVAAAVARTVSTLDGRCGAVVLVGDPAGAAATLDAVRGAR